MVDDTKLARWSLILLVLAVLTMLLSLVSPLTLLFGDAPVVLSKGTEIWKTTFHSLPTAEATALLLILMAPQLAWVIAVVQVARLAQRYRRGRIFELGNTVYFIRLGVALAVMGLLQSLVLPLVNALFYYRHISPWLADIPWLEVLQPDLIMAGAFFFVLGKIMERGAELHESDQLTV